MKELNFTITHPELNQVTILGSVPPESTLPEDTTPETTVPASFPKYHGHVVCNSDGNLYAIGNEPVNCAEEPTPTTTATVAIPRELPATGPHAVEPIGGIAAVTLAAGIALTSLARRRKT